ncbi:MAG: SCO family protein [Flavobacteriaceae bacterium]
MMRKPKSTFIFTALVLGVLFVGFKYSSLLKKELPVYNPSDIDPELVDGSLHAIQNNHRVSDFTLVNQHGDTITQEDYHNKIYVADFFFTRCPTICPIMSNNMAKLQEVFSEDDDVMLLSLSVTPVYDSVPVLKEYALKKGAIADKWHITTGDKDHIYSLARKSYFAVSDLSDGILQDFIHTPNFILIDREKQIRGIYDGTKDEEISRLVKDIRILQ